MSQFFNERSGLIICVMITVGCLQCPIQSNQDGEGGRGGGREGVEPKLKSKIFSNKSSL